MARLDELQDLYERVIASSLSSFYRDFYANTSVDLPLTHEQWRRMPLLQKSDIARVPFEQRIFVERSEVDIVRLTSGTTSSRVLAIPRVHMPHTEAERHLMPVDSYMGFLLPHRVYDNYTRQGARFVGGDPARLDESARLASSMKIEGIGALPSTLIAFAKPLAALYDITRIRHLCLNGDICTAPQRAALKTLYPGVQTMVSSYGSSETQGLCGISCDYPGNEQALLGHPLVHYEIVNDTNQGIATEGELVVSILYAQAAFPLLRYRTGDTVRVLEESADRFIFTVLGRTSSDRVRFSGGTILLAEIERAITQVTHGTVIDFEVVVGEDIDVNGQRLRLSLTLIAPEHTHVPENDIAERIEREMRISEKRSYREGVLHGLCAPLVCHFTNLGQSKGRKTRRLIDTR